MKFSHPDTKLLSGEVFALERSVLDPLKAVSLFEDVHEARDKRAGREQIAVNCEYAAKALEDAAKTLRAAAKRWKARAARCAPGDVSDLPAGDEK